IADPNVADVKVVSPGQVLVTAVGTGQTELTVWQGSKVTTYEVVVTSMDPRALKKEVEKLLGKREGIDIRIVRDSVYIEGEVLTLSDLEKADEVAKMYPQVRNMVKLDPSAHAHIAEAINKQLARAGLHNARASVVGATIFIEGMVDSQADQQKADIITRAMGKNIQTVLRVGPSRMIELDVEFVEISKTSLDRIGFRWPTDIGGTLTLTYAQKWVLVGQTPDEGSFSAEGVATASLGLALQFNDGVTRTLARPRLVTTSNQEAKFLAGGEIPIPIITEDRMYIEYKEYGIRLKIVPIAESSGTIQTKVLAEISDVDRSVSVLNIPGFITRRVDTEVTVRDGETIVLSGLLHMDEGKDVTKIPILGHIPILGELFKRRQFRERHT
ncbi:MAG: pilus assembly protein N-terminal domain-containing protein, partial [Deltaproteobacteria bacterium]|nr:pilus assembly protein N-terminal domain-containing protein [Deltaproteobacteria bacterium]